MKPLFLDYRKLWILMWCSDESDVTYTPFRNCKWEDNRKQMVKEEQNRKTCSKFYTTILLEKKKN